MAGSNSYDPSDLLGQLVGSPITITSGLRSPQHNAAVGGVPNSAHLSGQAYDFVPKGISTGEAANRIAKSGMPFDQVIDEGNHVHLSFAPTNRRQVIASKMAQNVSDDDLLNALGGGQAAAPSQGKDVSDEQLLGALGRSSAGTTTAAAAPAVQGSGQPSMLESASKGVIRGAKGVIGSVVPVDAFLARTFGFPQTANRLMSNLHAFQAEEPAFQQQYGTSGQVGEVLGQIGTALPVMAMGGEALAPALAGARAAAPAIAPALDFLTGATKGNKLLQLASRGTSGALQGASAAALTSGGSDQPIGDQLKSGAEFGTALNTIIPGAGMAGGALFKALHGAGSVSPARAELAQKAINLFGIPLRGSQISTSPFAHFADSAIGRLPLSGIEASNEAQREAFSRAVASTMGEDANNLSPEVMSSARGRIGKVFNDVSARTTIQDAPSLVGNIGNIIGEASQVLPEDSVKPLFKQLDNISSTIDPETKTISGQTYQSLTRKGSPLDRAMNSGDPDIRHYAGKIRDALDDALEASTSPQDLQALKTARLQWKNMRTIQDLASKANIEGDISPTALLGAVKKSYKDMAFSGAGDIGHLAQIGQTFLKETPNSTTAERGLLYSLLAGGAETLGEGLHDPSVILTRGAIAAGLLGSGKVAGSVLKSPLYRKAVLAGAGSPNTLNAVLGNQGRYVIPSAVIAGNRLLNSPDESASQ